MFHASHAVRDVMVSKVTLFFFFEGSPVFRNEDCVCVCIYVDPYTFVCKYTKVSACAKCVACVSVFVTVYIDEYLKT